jgi:hypothetical protein
LQQLRYLIIIFFSIFLNIKASAQNFYLNISNNNSEKNLTALKLDYQKKHSNIKSIQNELIVFKLNLIKKGFIDVSFSDLKKQNDSSFSTAISWKNKIDFVHIYIGEKNVDFIPKIYSLKSDSLVLPFTESESFLTTSVTFLENKGFAQAKVQLQNLMIKKNVLNANLFIDVGKKRSINDLVVVGYDKFPLGFKKNIIRRFKEKKFSTDNVKKLKTEIDNIGFVSQTKFPEVLFTKDTTKVYIYLQKSKPNRFDGLVGFANDQNGKLRFNGYLDLLLINTINAGERFNLLWKGDGNNQTNFYVGIDLPYIFKSRLALGANLTIFKQDSIFQNTKTNFNLGYLLNNNSKISIGQQNTESTSIQTTNTAIGNFKTSLTTLQFDFLDFIDKENPYYYLFSQKTLINFQVGMGNRQTVLEQNKQILVNFQVMKNLFFSQKFSIALNMKGFLLESDNYLTNELNRFGGINSIRGFNENSLQANRNINLMGEFRFALSPALYVHTVSDIGLFEDKTTQTNGNLIGTGLGLGVLTKNGLLKFIYANGNSRGNNFGFSNSIVHLSFTSNF